jgi:response regulator RpfG family c-di-GMP phosphodiesterase
MSLSEKAVLLAGWGPATSVQKRDLMLALVVEDSKTIRMILTEYLRKMDIQVVEAANGLEGLERL